MIFECQIGGGGLCTYHRYLQNTENLNDRPRWNLFITLLRIFSIKLYNAILNIYIYSSPIISSLSLYTILCFSVVYYTMLYHTELYYTMQYYTVIFYIILALSVPTLSCFILPYSITFSLFLFLYFPFPGCAPSCWVS